MVRKTAAQTIPVILILEDNEEWADLLLGLLAHEGYRILHASSLSEAKQALTTQTFALGLVDISLALGNAGDEEGLLFIEELQTVETLRDLPMIIITGYPTTERARKAFKDYGVYDFFDKGTLDPRELKRAIAECIARSYEESF
jgi:DNA-binding NtrC family response regulator